MLKTCQKSHVLPMKNVSVCRFKTSPCVPAPRAHMLKHVCAWCRYTRGRFERAHGDVLNGHTFFFFSESHMTHDNTNTASLHSITHSITHSIITETETETDRDRERRQGHREREEKTEEERQDKRRQEKRRDKMKKRERRSMAVLSWWSEASG